MSEHPFVNPDIETAMSPAEGEKLWELARGKVCLDLGSWKGYSAVCMAQSAEFVHCVDHFLGDQQAGFGTTLTDYFRNLQRFGVFHKIATHVGGFEQILPVLDGDSFDLVFCDGLHTAEATRAQAAHAFRLIRGHGKIAFHDYTDDPDYYAAGFRVKEVVDQIWGSHIELVGAPPLIDVVDTLAYVSP